MRQHGNFTLGWRGAVLVVTYMDTWNEEAVVALHAAARAAWSERPGTTWAMLTDASRWDGGTPEVLERWWEFFSDAVANGMTTVTDILPSSFHALLVKALAERASSMTTYCSSKDLDSAFEWLAQQGFASSH